ncbi:hypothetical protein GCM10007063_25370 [Lentibacillus kapialis]|uniref:Uncharacterized protein n=1 Tax=Lentibacillus kapialis TaxID=340214 RepID=A0A917V012_9BACI|nr:hypothetical protein [Lentibacillus kapialis]GGK02049.1 hypothetical protein GCM10007063_25370 [Lentibacillus kapialis]
MSFALFFIIGVFTIQVLIIITYMTCYHDRLSNMNGMVISMSIGMTTGILMGTILGVFLQGNLFESTLYGILIGLTVGFLAGLPIGLPAIIDGMLSGLMGGMMGAMLGDMVAATRPDAIIKIVGLIATMTLLLVLYMSENLIQKQSDPVNFFVLKHPYLLLFILTILFIGLNFSEPIIQSK